MRVSFVRQKNDYYCGPAVLAMVLGAHGIRISQKEAARHLRTTRKNGTSTKRLVAALKKFGLRVHAGNHKRLADLKAALAKKQIVIPCYIERHWDWDHFALVKKISKNSIVLIDPAERSGNTTMTVGEFQKRWKGPLFTNTDHWAAVVSMARAPRSRPRSGSAARR